MSKRRKVRMLESEFIKMIVPVGTNVMEWKPQLRKAKKKRNAEEYYQRREIYYANLLGESIDWSATSDGGFLDEGDSFVGVSISSKAFVTFARLFP
jgi:hypothetical protein